MEFNIPARNTTTLHTLAIPTASPSKSNESDAKVKELVKYLLVEDTSVEGAPTHLLQLFNWYKKVDLSNPESLFLLVYLIGVESGFCSSDEYEKVRNQLQLLNPNYAFNVINVKVVTKYAPPTYKVDPTKTIYTMMLRQMLSLGKQEDDQLHEFLKVSMVGIVINDLMIVTLGLAADDNGFSLSLPISRYILNMNVSGKPLYYQFQKLRELSRVVKDQLFMPMRCFQLKQFDMYPFPSLMALPEDIYDNIFMFLSFKDRKNFGGLSKKLQYLASQHKIRKNLVHFS